jgi:hypothetical protein
MSELTRDMENCYDLTEKRFWDFSDRAKDNNHLSQMINNRTNKMKNIAKLRTWLLILEDQNFHDEVLIVVERLRELGYAGNV